MGSGSSTQAKTKQAPPANFRLYVSYISHNSMACLLTCAALGIKPKLTVYDIFKGEHKQDSDFIAKNPFGAVPAIEDGQFVLWESRAVSAYIASKYGANSTLYPSEPHARALVDRVLYFEATSLQPKVNAWIFPIITKAKTPDEHMEAHEQVKDVLKKFEDNLLKDNKFAAGNNVTIADFSVAGTLEVARLLDFDLSQFPKVNGWMNRMKALPYFADCTKGIDAAKKSFS